MQKLAVALSMSIAVVRAQTDAELDRMDAPESPGSILEEIAQGTIDKKEERKIFEEVRAIEQAPHNYNDKVLVIGATGISGVETVSMLLFNDIHVVVGVRDEEKAKTKFANVKNRKSHLTIRKMDLDKPKDFAAANLAADVHGVILLMPENENMVQQYKDLMSYLKEHGKSVKHVVKLSTYGIKATDTVPVLRAHHQIDEDLKTHTEFKWSIIRANLFMSNHRRAQESSMNINYLHDQRDSDADMTKGYLYGSAKGGKVSYISPKDAAWCTSRCIAEAERLGCANKVYDVTGAESLSESDIAAILSETYEKEIEYVEKSPSDLKDFYHDELKYTSWDTLNVLGIEALKAEGRFAPMTESLVNDFYFDYGDLAIKLKIQSYKLFLRNHYNSGRWASPFNQEEL